MAVVTLVTTVIIPFLDASKGENVTDLKYVIVQEMEFAVNMVAGPFRDTGMVIKSSIKKMCLIVVRYPSLRDLVNVEYELNMITFNICIYKRS